MTLNAPNSVPEELVAICRWGLTLKPAASPEQLRCSLDLLRFWARLKVQFAFPEETAIMFSLFDEALVQALGLKMYMQLVAPSTT
jgi:hypothetical protein